MAATVNGGYSVTSSSSSTVTTSSSTTVIAQSSVIKDVTSSATTQFKREFGAQAEQALKLNSIDDFLDYVAAERLTSMPHRGSRWDKVLQWAAFFASQSSLFADALGSSVPQSERGAKLIFTSLYILIQTGVDEVQTLDKVFGVFYEVAVHLSLLLRQKELFTASADIQQTVAFLFADVVQLAVGTATNYGHGGNSFELVARGELTTKFGSRIESIVERKEQASNSMWQYYLQGRLVRDKHVDIAALREFLEPSDRIVKSIVTTKTAKRTSREEFTCEWFAEPLNDFTNSTRDKMLLVTGKSGSGKSVLSEWATERLFRAEGNSAYDVIAVEVDGDIRAVANPVNALLLQLLDRLVGHWDLYEALSNAVLAGRKGLSGDAVEQQLWQALDIGLRSVKNTVLLIDGLDELQGGEQEGIKILEHLNTVVANKQHIKSLVFTKPLTKTVPVQMRSVYIEPSQVQEDIRRVVLAQIARSSKLRKLGYSERDQIATRISTAADGSFAWAEYSLEILQSQSSVSAMLQSIEKLPKGVSEIITQVVATIDLKAHDTRSLLAWMLAAERPLRLSEIKTFYEIDTATSSVKSRFTDIEEDVINALGPLISINGGIVRFRHNSMRDHLVHQAVSVKDLSNSGAFPFALKEAHYDLAVRCVAYFKLYLTRTAEPSFDFIPLDDVKSISKANDCAEYAARFWISHFYLSPMYEASGKHKLVPEFRSNFPDSTLLARLEGSMRARNIATASDVVVYDLALSVRQTLLTQKSTALLQTLIFLAHAHEVNGSLDKAAPIYLQAYDLSVALLGEESETTFSITAGYLSATSNVKFTTRDETSTRREKMLRQILTHYQRTYGSTHDHVYTYTRLLAVLLTDTQQYDAAASVWEDVYNQTIQRYGHWSSEVTEVQRTLISTLSKSSHKEKIAKLERSQYDTAQRTLAVTDERRIASANKMLEYYQNQKNTSAYEGVLVDLWQSFSQIASTTSASHAHQRKIDTTLAYVNFLKTQNRTSEAQSVTRGLWTEYESQSTSASSSKEVNKSLLSVGKELRSLGMLSTAQSVFKKVASFFSSTGQSSSAESSEASRELSHTTQELITQRTQNVISSSSSSDEQTVSHVFDSISELNSSEQTEEQRQVSTSYILKTCQSVSQSYFQKGRISSCARVCSQALVTVWPSVLSRQAGSISLPAQHRSEIIEIAYRLAECYLSERQVEKAEEIYENIYKASRSSLQVTDNLVSESTEALIAFYERTYLFEKALKVHEDFYQMVKKQLGLSNALTIKTAYTVSDFALRLNKFREAEPYLLDIFTHYTSNSSVVTRESVRATTTLARFYREERRWESAEKVYTALWTTFLKSGVEVGFTSEQVEDIYTTFIHIKRDIKKVSYEETRQITVQYRETCVKYLGEDHELTLQATIYLAEINQQSEKHQQESISLYESAIKNSRSLASRSTAATATASAITTAIIMRSVSQAKSQLASIYSKSNSAEANSRAVALHNETYDSAVASHGYTHESSLKELHSFAQNASKSSSQDVRTKAITTLNKATAETIIKEKSTESLIAAAKSLASSYLVLNQKEAALEVYTDVRRQLVTGNYTTSKGLSVNGAGRQSYSFLISFWQAITGSSSTTSFSTLMADLMTETLLYQSYTTALKQKSSFETVFEHGSRLAIFYRQRRRGEEYQRVLTELLEVFAVQLNASKTSATLREFFDLCFTRTETGESETTIVQAVADLIYAKMSQGAWQAAYDLAVYIDKFVHLDGGWRRDENIEPGLQICLHLTGHSGTSKSSDQKVYQLMLEVSSTIMQEVLRAAYDLQINFIELPVRRLIAILTLLSEQKNYTDLEWILTRLWSTRNSQTFWDSVTVIWIGRRLVEVRYALGRKSQAIHLCEDISYNLRRVFGPFDATTLSLFELLSQLYTANGEYTKALAVHEEVLRQSIVSVELDGDLSKPAGASAIAPHLALLKRSYQRNGAWNKQAAAYADLFRGLHRVFGAEPAYTTALAAQGAHEKWTAKGKGQADDALGLWTQPAAYDFGFLAGGAAVQKQHYNHLRKTSGLVSALQGGPQMKISTLPTSAASQRQRVNGHANGVAHA